MSTDRFDSPEEAARYGFPAECRIVAMRKQGDAAYVLLDTGPAGRPYLYGVNCQRRDGSWSPGASGNGPGWSQVGADKELGTLTVGGDAPAGAGGGCGGGAGGGLSVEARVCAPASRSRRAERLRPPVLAPQLKRDPLGSAKHSSDSDSGSCTAFHARWA